MPSRSRKSSVLRKPTSSSSLDEEASLLSQQQYDDQQQSTHDTPSPDFLELLVSHATAGLDFTKKAETDTIYAGWIYKRGETVKSWRRRYLKVTPKEITYGKDTKTVLKTLPRSLIKHVEPCSHSDAPKDYKKYGFKVVMDKRALKVAVQTKREQEAFIYHISPKKLFGTDLDLLMTLESHVHATTPVVVEQCIQRLTEDGNLSSKGLFRISGSESALQQVTHTYDTGYIVCGEDGKWSQNPLKGMSPHVCAGILKKYLRELPDSVIPIAEYDRVIGILKTDKPKEEQLEAFKQVVSGLDRSRYITLNMVCFALYQTHLHNELMKASNLGLVMGPNLLKQSSIDMTEVMLLAKVAEFLIENYEQVFDKDAEYLLPFKRNIEVYSEIAQKDKDRLCKELALLKEEANEIDGAMSTLANLIGSTPEFTEHLYSQIYHAVYHVKVEAEGLSNEEHASGKADSLKAAEHDIHAVPVSYKSLYLDGQLKKHGLMDMVSDAEEASNSEEPGEEGGRGNSGGSQDETAASEGKHGVEDQSQEDDTQQLSE